MLIGVIALAAIGYVVGLRAGVPDGPPGLDQQNDGTSSTAFPYGTGVDTSEAGGTGASGAVRAAMSYTEIGEGGLRTKGKPLSWVDMVASLRPAPAKPVTDMRARMASLATRAERRAFNGAPPTIPHDTRGLSDRACLSCHGAGLAIDKRVARALPHPYLALCTQCHAPSAPAYLAAQGETLTASSWRGLATPTAGPRATRGAPPGIPHSTRMRNHCSTCHGPQGWPGVQTSHPERKNCLQCHALTGNQDHPGLRLPGARLLPEIRRTTR
jgi:cytochrome c-type protein NapB